MIAAMPKFLVARFFVATIAIASTLTACGGNSVESQKEKLRTNWRKEKIVIFDSVKSCALSPEEAIKKLDAKRDELSSKVAVGFSEDKVRLIAKNAKCKN